VLFRKRDKRGGAPYPQQVEGNTHPSGDIAPTDVRPQLYRIDDDMMLKGSFCKRGNGQVRQHGVTVNGATRLVTSGDTVDKETYEALLRTGAIRPVHQEFEGSPLLGEPPLVVDHSTADTIKE